LLVVGVCKLSNDGIGQLNGLDIEEGHSSRRVCGNDSGGGSNRAGNCRFLCVYDINGSTQRKKERGQLAERQFAESHGD